MGQTGVEERPNRRREERRREGRPPLDGEVSDEMYWTMVKESQRGDADASTAGFLGGQAVLDDEGMTLETEAFINGLIRFPSMLDLDANNLQAIDVCVFRLRFCGGG
jgi:hypothetical protein